MNIDSFFGQAKPLNNNNNMPQQYVEQPGGRRALRDVNLNVFQRMKGLINGKPAENSPKGNSAKKAQKTFVLDEAVRQTSSPIRSLQLEAGARNSPIENVQQTTTCSAVLSEDIMAHVMSSLEIDAALKARAVSKSWKKLVSDAKLEPLEAGLTGDELQAGLQAQTLLVNTLKRESEIWTPEHSEKMRLHMEGSPSLTVDMRRTLMNWLIEVHFKFRFRDPCLHLTTQLVARYMAANPVDRRKFQTVGVTAFMLGCKFEERHNPNLSDLSYITDYSSTRKDIVDMEAQMLERLAFDLVQPKPSDYLPRFAAAAGLDISKGANGEHNVAHSVMLFFLDISALDYAFAGLAPSVLAAAAVSAALGFLKREPWSATLSYYTRQQPERIASLVIRLKEAARRLLPQCPALQLKYSSHRFGGIPQGSQSRGIFALLQAHLAAAPEPPARAAPHQQQQQQQQQITIPGLQAEEVRTISV